MVRVRFAPSPTGHLHVGGVRTALFNWLYARNQGGEFILRIEDTDVKRSDQTWIDNIIEGLRWIGLDWDEGPYFQSQRAALYKHYFEVLKKESKVYPCFCSQEDLKEKKERYGQFLYDRHCYNLPKEEVERRVADGEPCVYRFLMPEKTVAFDDLIHGEIKKEGSELEDFVVVRSDGTPTYNFACVVDDHELKITHVIRAHEHIANTPKQIVLYEALHLKPPRFVHIPLILGPDKKKLSKRHGAVSLIDFREEGFLPEAMANFLALLGWTPDGDEEIQSIDEMVKKFSLKRVHRADAVFDVQKLEWMNGAYIRELDDEDLLGRLKTIIIKEGYLDDQDFTNRQEWLLGVVKAFKPRMKKLTDFIDLSRYLFKDEYSVDQDAFARLIDSKTIERFKVLADRYGELKDFNRTTVEEGFRAVLAEYKIKPKELIHPVRVKITGRTTGPGLFEIIELLGKERTIARLRS